MKDNISVMYWRDPPKGDDVSCLVKDLGITCEEVFKKVPPGCAYCGSDDIVGLEVYGSGVEPLFWTCEECEGLLLRYPINITQKRLLKATKVYTSPEDWEVPSTDKDNLN